jgi:hypothetical protein
MKFAPMRRGVLVLATVALVLTCLLGVTAVARAATRPGLVAAYGFDEGAGLTTADASGNSLTATISGAAWSAGGRFGTALAFNGANSSVTVSDTSVLDLTTGMTLEAWVKPTALSNWTTVVLKETPGGLAYALYASDNTGRPPATYVNRAGADVGIAGTAALPLNTWTHLAGTYDGATLRLYVNGVQVSSRAVTGSISVSASPLRFGGNAVWGEYFAGLIDEVRVYNRALTAAEIQGDMNVPVGTQGFQVEAYNDSLTLGLSATGTYDMLISPINGFTGAVTCSVAGLPAGATGIFEPPGGPPHPGPFALTVTTGSTTPPGTYQLAVTCVNGPDSSTKTLTLGVTTNPDFRVVVEPNSLILAPGTNGVAGFQLESQNGYAQPVTMGASGLPAGVSATFTPSAPSPPASGTVRLIVGAGVPAGNYPLQITATNGSLTRQAAFTLTVPSGSTSGSWRQQALGDTGAQFYGVIVGDVGNTGKNRVYASGGAGKMYEYAFDGASWSFSQLPVGVPGDLEMHNMDIGPGRNDGVNRLYIAVSGGDKVYELSWVNQAWQVALVANLTGATDISIGDGRNDGQMRMYITWMSGVTEFTWTGSAWTRVTMSGNEGGWVHGIDLGPGRGDGVNRVYTANQGNGQVHEYSWNGSSWTKVLIDGTVTDTRNIELGEARNDGKTRVYTAGGDGNVYEYSWTGSSWQGTSLGNAGVTGVKVQSIPAKAKGDNLVRIYAAAANGGVYEYTSGSPWQTVPLGAATSYMYGLEVGDGLNKGTTQVYGSSYDGNVYLFEWVPASSAAPDTNLVGTPPNPSASAAATFSFASTVAGSSFECKLDAGSFASCVSPQSYSGLADGSHTFQVRASDPAGNTDPTPASYTWTIATAPPPAPDTTIGTAPASPTSSTGASFAFTSSQTGSTFQCRLDGGSFAACTSPTSYSNLVAGVHTFEVRAVNSAGIVDPTPASHTWTIQLPPPDTSPPTVTSVTPANGASGVATGTTVTAVFSEPMAASTIGTSTLELRTPSNALVAATITYDAASRTGTLTPLAPLAASTVYTATVRGGTTDPRVKDAAGNALAASVTWSFTTAATAAPPPGLVAAYGFNEGSGPTVGDASGNLQNGTITGATWSTAGRFGGALSFNGTNNWVTIAETSRLDLTTGMTLEAWVRPTSLTGWKTVMLKERPGGLAYGVYASDNTSRPPAGYVNRSGADIGVVGTALLPLNTWTHLACTYDGASLRLYVNGAQVSSRAVTGAIAVSGSPLRIGGNAVWGEYFAGLIDEIRVYNRALTATEIQRDMNTPVGAAP